MEYLYSIGIFRIDGMILTHPDADHINGAALLTGRMPIGEAYGIADTDVLITQRTEITFADCKITIFPGLTSGTDNEKSLSVLCQPGKRAILITGDQTVAGENALVATGLPNLDYLVVGHHGSDTSTGETLLSSHGPLRRHQRGGNNRYGHPDQTVLTGWRHMAATVLRTDQNGTIIIRGRLWQRNRVPNQGLQELKAALSRKDTRGAYVFYGEEVFLMHYYLDRLKKLAIDEVTESFNFHELNPETFSMDALSEAVEALPMMAEQTMTVVDEVDFFAMDEGEPERMGAIFNDLPDYCTLVFTYETTPWKPDKRYKSYGKRCPSTQGWWNFPSRTGGSLSAG